MYYANRKLKCPIITVNLRTMQIRRREIDPFFRVFRQSFFYNKTHGFAVLPIVRICIVLKKYYCMQTKFLNLPATQAIKVSKTNI